MHAPPVPVPDPDALAEVPEPVTACPQCGFLGIEPAGLGDGVYAGGGELTLYACPRCGYRGQPVEFPRREAYAEFLRELAVAR